MATQIAVCGPADCTPAEAEWARDVGVLLARAGATVLCGGAGGVMAAVARGASSAGGLVIGVRPDADGRTPDDFSAVLWTGLGQARNVVLVLSADAIIAVGGSWGTLSEVALAMRRGRPVISLGGWGVVDAAGRPVPGVVVAADPAEAVRAALGAAG